MVRIALSILILLAAVAGCGKPLPPPAVKIVIEYPGALPKVVDDLVCAPVRQKLLGIDCITTITCVSSCNLAEIYVEGTPNIDASTLCQRMDAKVQQAVSMLPSEVKIRKGDDISGQSIPPPLDIHDVSHVEVNIDHEKAARLGVGLNEISQALKEAHKPGKIFSELMIISSDGKTILLTDVATLKTVSEPDHIVVRWPDKPQKK
jgi:multidrug efflux pump subunit AcrB